MSYPSSVYVESDRKQMYVRYFGGDDICIAYKLKYSAEPSIVGKRVKECLDNIDNTDLVQSDSYKSIPWKKRLTVIVSKENDGMYTITSTYVDHEIMTYSYIEREKYPSDVSDEELGKGVISALEYCYNYMLRKELAVYYSDQEGLLFVPMLISRTGYVTGDFCCCVKAPYNADDIRFAIDNVVSFISDNPEDKRTNKERKADLPWREYSKYKSMHGFVKTHYSIELHILTDGTYVFLPTLKFDKYDSQYVVYDCLKKTYNTPITNDDLKEEIFESLKISELIYKKSLEEDKTVHHDIFFGYVKQLVQERNRN